MNNIIKFKNPEAPSEGMYLDLECASFDSVMLLFSETEQLVSEFTDAFIMMGFSVELAEEAGIELYTKTRQQVAEFIKRKMSTPINYTHASALPLQ